MVASSNNLPNTPTNSNPELEGKPFGQKEPLTRRLNGLIRNYPKGVGILQEFIQNADDAGASEVKIVMDWSTHPSNKLPSQSMKSLMGPSLLIYNNQIFTDGDLEGIQEIGRGDKFLSTSKTGRFGLGFNACYNVTDCPSFVTRDHIHFFDPHHKYIPGADEKNPGRSWRLSESVWQSFAAMLSPFEVMGLETNQEDFRGTIFRLPLRTEEHAGISEISKEPFSKSDFVKLIEQLIDIGPELLLFLKHVDKIVVEEISENRQNHESLLILSTENQSEVQEQRNVINGVVADDAQTMISRLRQSPGTAPKVSYLHHIRIQTPSVSTIKTWRIVNGLYLDSKNEIITYAEKMIAHGEKTIPWAGAAALVPSKDEKAKKSKRTAGRIYCFLPLPIPGEFPVHINGFFDVDSSRSQATTNNQTLIGKDEIRSRWNEHLINHCIAQAYADLLENLVSDIGHDDPNTFYELWPGQPEAGLFSNLPAKVYENLHCKNVIHSAKDQRWVNPSAIFIAPVVCEKIIPAFVEAGMPIPDPALPSKIVNGFKRTKTPLRTMNARNVRDHFRITEDIDIPLNQFKYENLRDPKLLANILSFAMSDSVSDQWYRGLPFALLSDGHVHTIGYFPAVNVYLADNKARELFSQFPEWFVDPDFARECDLKEHREANIIRMEPEDVILNLGKVVGTSNDKSYVMWVPNDNAQPNHKWLAAVYEYILAHKDSLKNIKKIIDGIPLVPDQFNRLWEMGSASTPLLPRGSQDPKLLNSLKALSMPIVTGSPQLLAPARRLADEMEGLIWFLTPIDLIDLLDAQLVDGEADTPPANYDSTIIDPILDFLSSPQALDDLKNHRDRCSKLKNLPIFPTTNKELVSIDSPDVYLPGNYDAPSFAGKVKLYNTGDNGGWKSLYRLLDVKELDEATLVLEVLIPSFSSLDEGNQYKAIEWIRDNRSKAESEYKKKNGAGKSFRLYLGTKSIIRCEGGGLKSCDELYDPRNKDEIVAILDDQASFPDMNFFKKEPELWLEFFDELNIAKTPHANDILRAIDLIVIDSEPSPTKEHEKKLISIFQHLARHWDDLKTDEVLDSTIDQKSALVDALKKKNWLPAKQALDPGKYVGFQRPEQSLFRPSELFLPQYEHLVSSQKPIANISGLNTGIRTDMEFPEPTLDLVIAHFDYVLDLWERPGHGGIKITALEATVNEIYSYFGKIFENAEKEDSNGSSKFIHQSQLSKIRSHYLDKECLWDFIGAKDKDKKFWKPKHTYKEAVSHFEPFRARIEYTKNITIDHGYEALGRKIHPDAGDFADFLEEISYKNNGKVSNNLLGQVLYVLQKLSHLIREGEVELDNLLLPTQEGSLVQSTEIFVPDAPWYEGRIDGVNLVHDQVPPDLIEKLKVKRLSRYIFEELSTEPVLLGVESDEQKLCVLWGNTVQSDQFQKGITRLIHNEDGIVRTGDLKWLETVKFIAVLPIHTNLYLKVGWQQNLVGKGLTEFHYDETQNIVYVTAAQSRLMETYAAQAINQQLDPPLKDISNLITIITATADEIEKTLNMLRIPRLHDPLPIQTFIPYEDDPYELEDFIQSENIDIDQTSDVIEETDLGAPNYVSSQHPATKIATSIVEGIVPGGGVEILPPIVAGNGTSSVISSPSKNWSSLSRLRPGSSLSPSSKAHKRAGIFISRVFHEGYSEGTSGSAIGSQRMEIGEKAVERVYDFERRSNRIPKIMPHPNPGYDMESYSQDTTTILRYIEIKGLFGDWDVNGVSISPTQLDFAQQHPDTYWLYVVENVFDDELYRVYPILNPASRITEYRFDNGWKSLKDIDSIESATTLIPKIGMQVRLDDHEVAIIKDIKLLKDSVAVIRLLLQFDNENTNWILYRPKTMTLLA